MSLVALFAKSSPSNMSFSTSKKQSNFLWVDLSFKLVNNDRLTSVECKKSILKITYVFIVEQETTSWTPVPRSRP